MIHERDKLPIAEKRDLSLRIKSQERLIELFFRRHPKRSFTPFQISRQVFDDGIPITSVRRAMTDLTTVGTLIKCDDWQRERYGVSNKLWKLNPAIDVARPEQLSFFGGRNE